MKNAVT